MREIELACCAQLVEYQFVQSVPYAGLLPVVQSPPAGRARAKAQAGRQMVPPYAGLQHEQDAVERSPIRYAWSTGMLLPLGFGWRQ
ncbi:hypothetical protein WJ95_23920 [Burkholderia ubonensis]|nr:hypothetical protein WJ95_23920 [Burkholderia ubonensis]